jgi:hypothetical protein
MKILFLSLIVIVSLFVTSSVGHAANIVTSISVSCVDSNTASGTVTLDGPYTGDVVLKLAYHVPEGEPNGGWHDTSPLQTTTVSFNGTSQESYTINMVPEFNANTFRVEVVSPESTTKSASFNCNSTYVPYTHMAVTYGKHKLKIIQWYTQRRVGTGFNVYSGTSRLNKHIIYSLTHWYKFKTRHSIQHLIIRPVSLTGGLP